MYSFIVANLGNGTTITRDLRLESAHFILQSASPRINQRHVSGISCAKSHATGVGRDRAVPGQSECGNAKSAAATGTFNAFFRHENGRPKVENGALRQLKNR
jgi:hypothetical protein